MIRFVVAVVAAVIGVTAIASAAPPPRSATTGASAFLVRITIPGRDTIALGDLEWPNSTSADVESFQYPSDGSVVSVGRSRATVFASPGAAATTQSFAETHETDVSEVRYRLGVGARRMCHARPFHRATTGCTKSPG